MSESSTAETRPAAAVSATAHVMPLEPGLYCITHAPGATAPDRATGLPGVRVSPGPGAFEGQLTLCGFTPDGWLGRGDDAVMVRVAGGAAQVMVTIYQSPSPAAPPPQLQVIRLSAPTAAPPTLNPAVVAHVGGYGDVEGAIGAWVGERGSRRGIEGFALAPAAPLSSADIEYQAVLGRDWMSPPCEGGQFCGSRGMSLPILGLAVRLRGAAADTHGVAVSATFVDGSEAGPVAAGEPCRAESLAALEAFQVVLTPLGDAKSKKRRARS